MEPIEYVISVPAYSQEIYRFRVPFQCDLVRLEFDGGDNLDFYSFFADQKRVKLNLHRHKLDISHMSGDRVFVEDEFSFKITNREPFPYKVTVKTLLKEIGGEV